MKLTDFIYHLPEELIAQEPALNRDESRLLVLHRNGAGSEHRLFKDLGDYLRPGDTLVI
ncbi:MAG: S-adenosylmethionine:tRNA ribosyltransferase-isomerase, partial [Firmicutes bacterium]|nr:S-adenosylmethionine:tRNA ribosyltransferase-isomerase [Bacillota bacterium]